MIYWSARRHLEVAKFLCEAGASQRQAMHGVIKFLCEADACKDEAVQDGATPLCIALQKVTARPPSFSARMVRLPAILQREKGI